MASAASRQDETQGTPAVSATDRSGRLPVLLLRARRLVSDRFRKAFSRYNLSEPQFRVLLALHYNDFLDVTSLVERTDLQQASVSRILRDLEARGSVLRVPGRDDARRTVAILTPEGRQLVTETLVDVDIVNASMTDEIGEERLARALAALKEVIAMLEDSEEAPGADAHTDGE